MKLRCPNEPEDKAGMLTSAEKHEGFTQAFSGTFKKRLLDNGRQWALDRPVIEGETAISPVVCETCGAGAVEEEA